MKKITCLMICLCLLCSCGTDRTEKQEKPEEQKTEQKETEQNETAVIIDPSQAQDPAEKNERITVHTDPSGNVKDIEDIFTLVPKENAKAVRDISSLSDIWNKEGDEEYIRDTDGTYVWNCLGEDITASGTGSAELPVSVKITYYLNDREISAAEIAGKSGHIRIRFDYENKTGTGKNITPFAAMTALSLSETHFSNISGTNMKLISTGGQAVLVGIAFPGWKDALPLSGLDLTKDIELPAYLEAEADTDSFELEFTSTIFTNGLLRDLDDDSLKGTDDIDGKIDSVMDAIEEMASAGKDLYSGADTFETYLKQYTDGVTKVQEGTKELSSGTKELYEQSAALETGAAFVSEGLSALKKAVTSLDPENIAANLDEEKQKEYKEARDALVKDAQTLMDAAEDLKTDTDACNAFFKEAETYTASVSEAVSTLKNTDLSMITKAAQDAESAQTVIDSAKELLENEALTEEEKEKLSALITSAEEMRSDINAMMYLVQTIQDTIAKIQNVPALPDAINNDSTKETAADMIMQISRINEAVKDNIPEIDLKKLLEDACAMKEGIIQLADGSVQLKEGISAFRSGISQMKTGTEQLHTGMTNLSTAGTELNNGYSGLKKGIGAFRDGLKEFRDEGKEKIDDLGLDEISDLMNSLKTLRNNDRNWRSYSGIADGTEGSTVFIFESESIKTE
ncbi:MAG: hypothetical protein K6A40_03700 [Solobacterium sp.]|nr:hypothetical protein [Solobacterium sp.]